jgi:hypothetical protein
MPGALVLGGLVLSAQVMALGAVRAQDDAVMTAVRQALAPALPFPASDEAGALPAGGNTAARWMVRPLQPDERTIEVLANPLNDANQARAARAMAEIENNIQAAQRRAQVQYDSAVAEAKRTGRSQEVDGVTLSDEGVAGARIDAESHVTIDVAFNQPSYTFTLSSSVEPALARQMVVPGAAAVVTVPSNVYRAGGIELLCEGESQVYLGSLTAPDVRRTADDQYQVTAGATMPFGNGKTLVLRLRGNEMLIADVLKKTDWNALLELLK